MIICEIIDKLDLKVMSGGKYTGKEIKRGYVSDMMSDVIANCRKGDIWITFQTHLNTIAVAGMKEVSAVIFIKGRTPGAEVIKKADELKIPLLCSSLTAFEIAGRLYKMGISG